MFFKTFRWSMGVTAVTLAGVWLFGGPKVLTLVVILSLLEISLSFDNAVINATVLERLSPYWQRIFLTVGIVVAVIGMRLLFPLAIVGVTAHLNPIEAVRLALAGGSVNQPGTYAAQLHAAHPAIAAFGGTFLFMLFLDFIFEDRAVTWLSWLERPLSRIGRLSQLSIVVALVSLVVSAEVLADKPATVMIAGGFGIVTYLLVNGLGELFEAEGTGDDEDLAGIHGDAANVQVSLESGQRSSDRTRQVSGKSALFLFLYLEVLDASFSFDGVIGAFAITQSIFIIAVGLGIGAIYIRSLTVFLVRKGTLSEYVFLEHGAHWAIGALAVILLITIRYDVPEIITGLVGVAFIAAALLSSTVRNRRGGLVESARERHEALVAGT